MNFQSNGKQLFASSGLFGHSWAAKQSGGSVVSASGIVGAPGTVPEDGLYTKPGASCISSSIKVACRSSGDMRLT